MLRTLKRGEKHPVVLDSAPLITLCSCEVEGHPIIDKLLRGTLVMIPDTVKELAVDARRELHDAAVAKRLIEQGKISVFPEPASPQVEDYYNLGEGQCAVIRLALKLGQDVTPILDERGGFLIACHYGLHPMFLLDLIVALVQQKKLDAQVAQTMVESAKVRYPGPHLVHVQAQLEELK